MTTKRTTVLVRIVLCLAGIALPVFSQRIPVPPSGTVAISCRVGGAPYQQGKIFVDGREVGACPGATVQLSTGAHSVRAGEALGNDRYMAYQNERVEVQQEIPTIGFCEMVKNAPAYFDKTVRLIARYEMATEGSYLRDDNCPLSHDQQIGAGFAAPNPKQQKILNAQLRRISTSEYGGRAVVTVVGVLRNSSRHDFVWYQYHFDIIRVEDVAPVTVPYKGELQAGVTYQAKVRAGDPGGLSLVPALRLREHYATRIEWTNLNEFPELKHLSDKARVQPILFTVLSDEIRRMTETRWNRTIKCKIVHVD